jgi:hypothetical protein
MSARQTADILTIVSLAIVTWGTARQAGLELEEYRDLFGRVPTATARALIEQLPLGRGKYWKDRDLSSSFMKVTRVAAFVIGFITLLSAGGLTSYIMSVAEDVPTKMIEVPDEEMPAVVNAAKKDAERASRLVRKAVSWFLIMIGSIVGIIAGAIVLYLGTKHPSA